jgi:hypothetical protein
MGLLVRSKSFFDRLAILIGITGLVSACGGSGSGEASAPPLALIDEGDVISVEGQSFYVSDISEDGSTITIMAYLEGFVRSVNVASFVLQRSEIDGLYRFNTASLTITYNPTSGSLTWALTGNPTLPTLANEVVNSGTIVDNTDTIASLAPGLFPDTDGDGTVDPLDSDDDGDGVPDRYDSSPLNSAVADIGFAKAAALTYGVSFLPSVPNNENWSLGAASTNNIQNRYSALESLIREERSSFSNRGLTPHFDFNFDYDSINVVGVEQAHQLGWTGLGANIYIIDGFEGNYSVLGYDYFGTDVYITHGFKVSAIAWAIAPEANYTLIEYFSPNSYNFDFSGITNVNSTIPLSSLSGYADTEADVANLSIGVDFTSGASIEEARISAANFVENRLQLAANLLPNSVIVQAAGNNGGISALSIERGCISEGGRNTTSSCTDAFYTLDTSYYDALDRTILVGAYDFMTEDLTAYSVSAGLAANHFIVADGSSLLDTTEGTSYAAPRVTGAIGLISQKFPELSPQGRKGLILDTATDLGATGVDAVFGHGLLNVDRALNPLGMLE